MDYVSAKLLEIAQGTWAVGAQMAPYLLFGFLMAGVLSVLIAPGFIERHLGRGRFWPIVKAALFSVPIPLCSCGVIPVAAGLRKHGASKGATTAFLISTPQTGADNILAVYALLGPLYALFSPFAALFSGALGGFLVDFFDGDHVKKSSGKAAARCTEECCNDEMPRSNKIKRIFSYGFWMLPKDLAPALLVGLLLAGVISTFIPHDFFQQKIGTEIGGRIITMLLMLLIGIPIYVCSSASIPIAAALVIGAKLSPGAALVFLMSGPATNTATITTIWKTMGHRTAIIYLISVAVSALACGLMLDAIICNQQPIAHFLGGLGVPASILDFFLDPQGGVKGAVHIHEKGLAWWQTASAIVLLALLVSTILRKHLAPMLKRFIKPATIGGQVKVVSAEELTLNIKGMTCAHCVETVRRAIACQPGVESVNIDFDKGLAEIAGRNLDKAALCRAIDSTGFQATVGV